MKITIEVNENTASDLADILCYFAGFIDAKGEEEWRGKWIIPSIETLRDIKKQIDKNIIIKK